MGRSVRYTAGMATDLLSAAGTGQTGDFIREWSAIWAQLPNPADQRSESLAALKEQIATIDAKLASIEDQVTSRVMAEAGRIDPGATKQTWDTLCGHLRYLLGSTESIQALPSSRAKRLAVAASEEYVDRMAAVIRTLVISWSELDLAVPDDLAPVVWTVRIPPLAYFRAMVTLFWAAVRHPMSETTIDLSTGRVLYRT